MIWLLNATDIDVVSLRKGEYVPWLVVAIVVTIMSFCFIAFPTSYSPIVVEITGTLIGFLAALSFAELIRVSERLRRTRELVKNLLDEMKYILSALNDDLFWFDIDMWKMAISSGELMVLDEELIKYFRSFYSYAQALLDMGNVLKTALANDNDERANDILNVMKPFKEKMREVGEIVLKP